jgi:DNA polymerase III subunit gamma/tau
MFGVKYRPLDFDSVLGLDNIKDVLKATIRSEEIDPAYLFVGDYSTGKTTLGRIFARSLLCTNRKEDMSPCNECESCKDFLSERNQSYIEIDAANGGSKEKIQDLLELLKYDTISGKTIILLDECQEISKAGKDALLVELEKENKNVMFIFCTTEIDKMPKTLRSRCQEFQIPQPIEANVIKKLKTICELNNLKYTPDALYTLVQASGRHYRDAENKLGLTSKLGEINEENVAKVAVSYNKEISFLLAAIPYDLTKTLKAAEYLTSRMNIKDIYEGILRILNDTIKYNQGFAFENATYAEYLNILSKQYGTSAFEVLDYLLTKQRLNDITLFYSDLLIIHYKFLQCHFDPKVIPSKAQPTATDKKEPEKKIDRALSMEFINKQPPWEKEELIRKIKHKKLQEQEDNRQTEKVSQTWGPQYQEPTADKKALLRGKLSSDEFSKVVKGSQNEEFKV